MKVYKDEESQYKIIKMFVMNEEFQLVKDQ
jgi:hypothetical protein